MAFCPFPVSSSLCCLPWSVRESSLLSYQVDVCGVWEMKGKVGLSFINSDFLDNHQTISKRYKPYVLKKPGATRRTGNAIFFPLWFPLGLCIGWYWNGQGHLGNLSKGKLSGGYAISVTIWRVILECVNKIREKLHTPDLNMVNGTFFVSIFQFIKELKENSFKDENMN